MLEEQKQSLYNSKEFASSPIAERVPTEQQQQAIDGILEYIFKSTHNSLLLQGYAGVGKSFVINEVISRILEQDDTLKIGILAPTNMALKILRKLAHNSPTNVYYSTIHSAHGLKRVIENDGTISFKQTLRQGENARILSYNIVICDEVSMLNDELFDMTAEYASPKFKIIWVGDAGQIQPVQKSDRRAKPFLPKVQKEHGIGVITLDQIVRQAAGSPIIKYATEVRQRVAFRKSILNRETLFTDSGNVVFLTSGVDTQTVLGILTAWFSSEKFKDSDNYAKVIAWSNDTVNRFNTVIRKIIYGGSAPMISKGEKILSDEPLIYINPNGVEITVLNANENVEVDTYQIATSTYQGVELTYYDCVVLVDGEQVEHRVKILHETSLGDYNKILEMLVETAKYQARIGKGYIYWKAYYDFIENFLRWKYNYAITCHKSQGSTFRNVLVVESDIDENWDVVQANTLKYTTITRASHNLVIIA
jgi:hypothetical protein